MAYEPTVWKNRVVERPLTFNMVNNPDGTVTLVPAPGVIVESGTPVNAVNLNKLEQGLKTHEADNVQHGTVRGQDNELYTVLVGNRDFINTFTTESYGGAVYDFTVDGEYFYLGGVIGTNLNSVKKYSKDTGYLVGIGEDYGGRINSLEIDDNFVYVGGQETYQVKKYKKSDLSLTAQSSSIGSVYIDDITLNGDFIYACGSSKTVTKLNKDTLSQVAQNTTLEQRPMAIATDSNFAYVCGDGKKVQKLDLSNLSVIATSTVLSSNTLKCIAVDDNYIYTAGDDKKVFKLDKNTLGVVNTSDDLGFKIIDLDVDDSKILVGGVVLNKADLSIALKSGEFQSSEAVKIDAGQFMVIRSPSVQIYEDGYQTKGLRRVL